MAWVAVYWMERKTWSIRETKEITAGDHTPGSISYILYQDQPYKVRVLAVSDDREKLAKLQIDKDGKVVPGVKALNDSKVVKKVPKKKKQGSSSSSGGQLKPVFKTTLGQQTAPPPSADVDAEDSLPLSLLRRKPVLPRATPEVASYLGSLLAFINHELNSDSSADNEIKDVTVTPSNDASTMSTIPTTSQPEEPSCSGVSSKKPTTPTGPGDEMVPLVSGSNVLIKRRKRSVINKSFKTDPEEMLKSLLLEIIGENELKNMRARNKGVSEFLPIPLPVMKAIEEFVATYSIALPRKKVTKLVNNFCQSLRNPGRVHKRQAEPSGKPPKPKKLKQDLNKTESVSTSPWKVSVEKGNLECSSDESSDQSSDSEEASKVKNVSAVARSLEFASPKETLAPSGVSQPVEEIAAPSGVSQAGQETVAPSGVPQAGQETVAPSGVSQPGPTFNAHFPPSGSAGPYNPQNWYAPWGSYNHYPPEPFYGYYRGGPPSDVSEQSFNNTSYASL